MPLRKKMRCCWLTVKFSICVTTYPDKEKLISRSNEGADSQNHKGILEHIQTVRNQFLGHVQDVLGLIGYHLTHPAKKDNHETFTIT